MARATRATRRCAKRSPVRYGVAIEQVVAADGTSMANFLAMAALIAPGDEVLVEHPTYEPLLARPPFSARDIRRFERKAADAFRLDPATVETRDVGPNASLIILTNLHNPSGALADEAELRAIGELRAQGARCWSMRSISMQRCRRDAAPSTSDLSSLQPTA